MLKYWVVYNDHDAFWCYGDEAVELMKHGWRLLGITNSERVADHMLEKIAAV